MIFTSAAAAFTLMSIAGCETSTGTERDYGNSVRLMTQSQIQDPSAAMLPDPDAVDSGDGERLNHVVEAYREPTPEQTRPQIESNPFAR
jgi:type IV pilus biogenesis protein CpaD/CtpE